MNAAFLTFTCARDADLVPLWAEGIRRILPDALLFCAVDHADADMPLPKKCRRLVTAFERRGNLNGIEAVAGILATAHSVAAATGLPVVKIDCDTVLTGSGWLTAFEDPQLDYLGFEGGHPLTATGICYAFGPRGPEKILRAISPWPWQQDGKFPEDQTICALAHLHANAWLRPWAKGRHVLAFLPSHFGEPSSLAACSAAVHCGQATTLSAYGSTLQRAHLVARQMRATLRALKRARRAHMPSSPPSAEIYSASRSGLGL